MIGDKHGVFSSPCTLSAIALVCRRTDAAMGLHPVPLRWRAERFAAVGR
jgi:hypothetical protein